MKNLFNFNKENRLIYQEGKPTEKEVYSKKPETSEAFDILKKALPLKPEEAELIRMLDLATMAELKSQTKRLSGFFRGNLEGKHESEIANHYLQLMVLDKVGQKQLGITGEEEEAREARKEFFRNKEIIRELRNISLVSAAAANVNLLEMTKHINDGPDALGVEVNKTFYTEALNKLTERY